PGSAPAVRMRNATRKLPAAEARRTARQKVLTRGSPFCRAAATKPPSGGPVFRCSGVQVFRCSGPTGVPSGLLLNTRTPEHLNARTSEYRLPGGKEWPRGLNVKIIPRTVSLHRAHLQGACNEQPSGYFPARPAFTSCY